jgi:hypothetical protein
VQEFEDLPMRAAAAVLLVLLTVAGCNDSPEAPAVRHDLTGHWSGFALIPSTPLPTPLEMDLQDVDGILTGAGGGVDCRYFATCGYFYRYTVTGSHDSTRVTIRGLTPEERSWVLSGTLAADGLSMSGIGQGLDAGFPPSSWQMEKKVSTAR